MGVVQGELDPDPLRPWGQVGRLKHQTHGEVRSVMAVSLPPFIEKGPNRQGPVAQAPSST